MRLIDKGIVLTFMILCLVVFSYAQSTQALSEGWFEYNDNGDGTATITGYTRDGLYDVIIPETIGGLTVTEIGEYAFFNKGVSSVTIPSSVKTIREAAFNNSLLSNVNLSEGLTYIGDRAFANNRIQSVTIPASVTHIGTDAFSFNPNQSVSKPHEITIRGYDPSEARSYAMRTGHTFVSLTPYSVTYQDNGATSGSVPNDDASYLQGESVTVLGNIGNLTRAGYHFAGWNTRSNGSGTTYNAGDTFNMGLGNVTLYAKWEQFALPTITLLGDNPLKIEKESVYNDPGATAKDYSGAELTVTNNSASAVNTSTVGEYIVVYTATDEFGRTTTTNRTVLVVPPVITATGGYEVVTVSGAEVGATITLYNHSGVVASGVADASGQFEFTNINAGSDYYLTQTINGITSLPSAIITVKGKVSPQAPSAITTPPSLKGGETIVYWEAVHEDDWGTGKNRHYVVELYDGSESIAAKIIDGSDNSAKIVIPSGRNTRDAKLRVKTSTEHGESNGTESEKFIIDNTAPTLTITPNLTEVTNREIILTVTATDEHSGVKQVRVANGTWINGASFTYEVTENGIYTFEVEDYAGNTHEQSISITNIDNILPTIVLTKNPSTATNQHVMIEATITNVGSGIANKKWASGIQSIDYFATEGISFTEGAFSVTENGTYTVYVKTLAGNEAIKTIEITTIDREKPIITLIGDAVIHVRQGAAFTDKGVRAFDNLDGDISERVIVSGDAVDTSTLGDYTIYYDVTDQAGNVADQVSRVVKVIKSSVSPPNEAPPPIYNDSSSTDGDRRSQTELIITEAGGIVKANGVTLEFPRGVVAERTFFKVERLSANNFESPLFTLFVSDVFEISKSSQKDISQTFTITLPLKRRAINQIGIEYELRWFDEENGIWTRLKKSRLHSNENSISGEAFNVGKFAVVAVIPEVENQFNYVDSLIKRNQLLPLTQPLALSTKMLNRMMKK